MGRKIAIVGAGAVGGYAGAHMVQAGEDVTFIDPWPYDRPGRHASLALPDRRNAWAGK